MVMPQRSEMYFAVSGSLIAENDTQDADSNHLLVASRPPKASRIWPSDWNSISRVMPYLRPASRAVSMMRM